MLTNASLAHADLPITLSEAGAGRPVLLLHGGGGPATVAGLAQHLSRIAHTLTPVHPGWDGTHRPAWLTGIDDLALAYLHNLRERELSDVLV
ncbi:alpha/beta fold hydrolase, partial [Streptomyces sp. DT225]